MLRTCKSGAVSEEFKRSVEDASRLRRMAHKDARLFANHVAGRDATDNYELIPIEHALVPGPSSRLAR